jgi:hypothetical protein
MTGIAPWKPESDGKELKSTALLNGAVFHYSISEVDKITINSESIDLNKGRVFMCVSDGTVRQLPLFPERMPKELNEFANALPAEMFKAEGKQALKPIPMREAENLTSVSTFLNPQFDIPVDWKMTLPGYGQKPAKDFDLKGKLRASYVNYGYYTAIVIHVDSEWFVPVCMLVSHGKVSVNPLERRSDARKLERTAILDGRNYLDSISEVGKITINSETFDLSKGRVIECNPDGTLSQKPLFPERVFEYFDLGRRAKIRKLPND